MDELRNWRFVESGCELLAFSLRYPNMQLAEAIESGEWLDAAREIAVACGWRLPDGFGSEDLAVARDGEHAPDAENLMHTIRAEATYLFVGSPRPAVSPYEGIWRADDDGVQGLLYVNPHSIDVERFMRDCGLGRPEGTNEPVDHLATELEFMQYLASLAGGAKAPEGTVASERLPGGGPRQAFSKFFLVSSLLLFY